MLPKFKKYVVIGAGVHGLSTAWHLAKQLKARGKGSGEDIIVLDKTGVQGTFDAQLTFVPEPLPGFPPLPPSDNGVSIFTALPEQFGLKLEPAQGLVEFLIVNSVERPTQN